MGTFDDDGPGLWFGLWFAFCTLLSLAFLGFIAWAIYQLVTWVTAQ